MVYYHYNLQQNHSTMSFKNESIFELSDAYLDIQNKKKKLRELRTTSTSEDNKRRAATDAILFLIDLSVESNKDSDVKKRLLEFKRLLEHPSNEEIKKRYEELQEEENHICRSCMKKKERCLKCSSCKNIICSECDTGKTRCRQCGEFVCMKCSSHSGLIFCGYGCESRMFRSKQYE